MAVGSLVIKSMRTIVWIQSMIESERGSMVVQIQKQNMAVKTMTTMKTQVEHMMIQMAGVSMIVIENLSAVMIVMIKWMMMVMVMIELYPSRKMEITAVQVGPVHVTMNIRYGDLAKVCIT